MSARPSEIYETTLRAMLRLLDRAYGAGGDHFAVALGRWQRDRDAADLLRWAGHGGMGSYWDGAPAILDEERGVYVGVPWADGAFGALRSALPTIAEAVAAGAAEVPVAAPEPVSWTDRVERCSLCRYEFVRRGLVEGHAEALWRHFEATPAVLRGHADEVVDDALAGGTTARARELMEDVAAALARRSIDVVPDSFRDVQVEGIDVDLDEQGRVLDESGQPVHPLLEPSGRILSGDDPCPRCGANEWHEHWITLTGPPVEIGEGQSPSEWLADRGR